MKMRIKKRNCLLLLFLFIFSMIVGGFNIINYFFVEELNPSLNNDIKNNNLNELGISWGDHDQYRAYGVAVDSLDNVYITGRTYSYGAGNYDMFLAKYDSLGNMLWDTTWGGAETDAGKDIVIDNSDNIYITGFTNSFGAGEADVFLVKYNSSGELKWNVTWGGTSSDYGYSIAIYNSNLIYIVGDTYSFGKGHSDGFLLRYNSSGVMQWNTTWGSTWFDYGKGVKVYNSNNIYVVGYKLDFDIFLANYNSSGFQKWNTTWGGSGTDEAMSISTDSSGNIYITGMTDSFGAQGEDMFLAKYNNTGGLEWNTTWGGDSSDSGNDIALDSSDNIFITGYTQNYDDELNEYAFLVKYDSSHVLQWNKTWGGDDYETGFGIGLDSSDNIYITGVTESYGNGASDAFLAKYNNTGDFKWSDPSIPSGGGSAPAIDGYLFLPFFAIVIVSISLIIRKMHK
ncbi:MAG: hypothetical protein EU547_01705 [Promethearchaeota archaeon]|nr:MAG: hypothetical protein EU547_01705 [Candidatus Lokiarchaeota archaeon]